MGCPLLVFPYVRFVMGSRLRTVRLGCSLAAPWRESLALHLQDREQQARGDCPPDSVLQGGIKEGHRQASPRRWHVRKREQCRRPESDDAEPMGGSPLIKCSTEILRVNRDLPLNAGSERSAVLGRSARWSASTTARSACPPTQTGHETLPLGGGSESPSARCAQGRDQNPRQRATGQPQG